jgi:Metallo-beta-lactamase superfamily
MTQASPAPGVTIRMYRGILGDCFLLKVAGTHGEKRILIDCGVLQNVQDGKVLTEKLPPEVLESVGRDEIEAVSAGPLHIRRVGENLIDDLKDENGISRIDVLVVTHEHYDHISGFALARDLWQSPAVEIGQLWMAWTENEADEDAKLLRAQFDRSKQAVVRAAMAGELLGAEASNELRSIRALADFLGPVVVDGMELGVSPVRSVDALKANAAASASASAAGGRMTTAETMAMLKAKATPDRTRYLEPGQVIDPTDGPGLKTYVLGPPRNIDRLKKDTPSGGAAKEVYLTTPDQAHAVDLTAKRMMQRAQSALGFGSAQGDGLSTSARPFANPHNKSYDPDSKDLQPQSESPARKKIRELYESVADLRIDAEWLAGAEALALKLDSDTNNTSLVLAFELPDQRVLLFAADAQVGNWESWGDQKYPSKINGLEPPPASQISIDTILSRVTFYKVGHHGSHNATAKQRGLELMTGAEMVAAIPVVRAVAKIQGPGRKTAGRGWKMPYDHLYERLLDKTRSRIVLGDGDPTEEQAIFAREAPTDLPITVKHADDRLWTEISIPF